VGNYVFNNFTYIAVNILSQNVSAADIGVNATVNATGPDVVFTPDSALQAGGLVSAAEYIFGFEVTSTNSIPFQSVMLSDFGTVTGLSTATVAEVDCNGGLLQLPNQINHLVGVACLGGGPSAGANAALPLGTNVSANANIILDDESFSIDVLKDVTLTAALGTASVTSIGQQFTPGTATTPEPTSFLLGGCGLIGLALVRRRKAKKAVKPSPYYL
jgi:hypothetical protein